MQKIMLKRKKINIKTCILSTFILMCFFAFTIIVNNTNKTLGRVPTVAYDTDNNDNNISDWLEYFTYTRDDTNHIITLGVFDKTTYGTVEIDEIDVYSKAYLDVAGEKVLYDVVASGSWKWMFSTTQIKSFFLNDLDTTNLTDMEATFENNDKLTYVDLKNLKTDNMENFAWTFKNCTSLEEVVFPNEEDFSIDDELLMESVTNMQETFLNCALIQNLDLSAFHPLNVQSINQTFNGCSGLESIDFGDNFDCSSVRDMHGTFQNCSAIKSLDLSAFHPVLVQDMENTFIGCTKLESIDFGDNFDCSSLKNLHSTFNGCSSLKKVDFGQGFKTTSAFNDMDAAFYGCSAIEEIRFGDNFDGSEITTFNSTFNGCNNIKILDMHGLKGPDSIAKGTNYWNMFYGFTQLEEIYLGELDLTGQNLKDTFQWLNRLNYFNAKNTLKVFDMSGVKITLGANDLTALFDGYTKLETVKFGKDVDFSNCETMMTMFYGCTNLKEVVVDGSTFDTSNVTNMQQMFYGCTSMTTEKINQFVRYLDTTNVTTMYCFFYGCSGLTGKLDLTNFKGDNLDTMANMFGQCKNLEEIDLKNLNTPKLTNLYATFDGCENLKKIDLSSMDCSLLSSSDCVFRNTYLLEEIKTPMNVPEITSNYIGFSRTYNTYDGYMYDSEGNVYTKLPTLNPTSLTLTNDLLLYTDPDTHIEYHAKDATEISGRGDPWGSTNVMIYEFSDKTAIVYGSGNTYECNDSLYNSVVKSYTSFDIETLIFVTKNPTDKIVVNSKSFIGGKSNLKKIINMDKITFGGTSDYYMFQGCYNLESIDFSLIDTTGITNMRCMFFGCKLIDNFDLSRFDTSSVTTMADMFEQCTFETIDVSSLDTSKVEDFGNMFAGNENLKNINISTFKLDVPCTLNNMFMSCTSLEKVDMSFDATNATSMSGLLGGATNLKEFKVPTHVSDSIDVNLPIKMYDIDGHEYEKLPTGLNSSLTLYNEVPHRDDPPGGGGSGNGGNEEPKKPTSTTITVGGSSSQITTYINGYVNEKGEKVFKPNSYISRSEIATILARISSGYNKNNEYKLYNQIYNDIRNIDTWYSNSVGYVTKVNVMEGYEGSFYPEDNLTRGQFAAALCRFRNINLSSGLNINNHLKDVKDKWYEPYVNALYAFGYIKGYEDNTFLGDKPITRAEACTLINRILNVNIVNNSMNKTNNYKDIKATDWFYQDIISSSLD